MPVPLAPDVTVIKDGLLLTAVQSQSLAAETATVPVPPFEETDWLVGEIE